MVLNISLVSSLFNFNQYCLDISLSKYKCNGNNQYTSRNGIGCNHKIAATDANLNIVESILVIVSFISSIIKSVLLFIHLLISLKNKSYISTS
jgi:hypothetical protein